MEEEQNHRSVGHKLYDLLFRFQKTILGLAIFLSLLAVSVRINGQEVDLV